MCLAIFRRKKFVLAQIDDSNCFLAMFDQKIEFPSGSLLLSAGRDDRRLRGHIARNN
jgi:hypothetical protein